MIEVIHKYITGRMILLIVIVGPSKLKMEKFDIEGVSPTKSGRKNQKNSGSGSYNANEEYDVRRSLIHDNTNSNIGNNFNNIGYGSSQTSTGPAAGPVRHPSPGHPRSRP